jgi:hypothetical protein
MPMEGSSAAVELARWVGRKGKGRATLVWGGQELKIQVSGLQILAVEGDDQEKLASAFGLTEGADWFSEARRATESGTVSQAEASAVVKRALADRFREFFLASDASARFEETEDPSPQGLTISYPHLVVEMILGAGGEELVPCFIPDPDLVLRRFPDFLRRVGALALTQEAMAVLAKINDQRTAKEIAEPSPHGRQLAMRLLAAAVGGGLAEATPKVAEVPLVVQRPQPELELPVAQPRSRRWVWLVLALVAVGVLIALLVFSHPWRRTTATGGGGPWAVAVDGGCQPSELEGLYRRQDQDPVNFRVVPFGRGQEQCYRLVWGGFKDKESAERAMAAGLPAGVVARAFVTHVVFVQTQP